MSTESICVLDVETRSAVELGRGGTNAHNYSCHPTTDVWMACYSFDNQPDDIRTWLPGEPMPEAIRAHLLAGGVFSFHNASFEFCIWNNLLAPRYGWDPLPLEQGDDTAARAARCGLPRSLEKGAEAMGLSQQKDKKGAAQMKRMAKPRRAHRIDSETITGMSFLNDAEDGRNYTAVPLDPTEDGCDYIVYEWWSVPDRVERLHAYCQQDVRTQMEMHLLLPRLPDMEWEIWQATMRANIRGCQLDVPFVRRAIHMIHIKLNAYAQELLVKTDGRVKSHTDLNGMKAWLADQGLELDGLDKNVVARLVADETLSEAVHRVVSIRAEAGKSSVAKFPAMELHADERGIAHDQLVYYGAQATGRWSALGFQLHNLPARGGVGYQEAEWYINAADREPPQTLIELMETLQDGSAVEVLSMCLRGAIRARDGMDVVCADYSNIEGRFAAWLGGEQWKLDAFRAFDEGTGPDLYKVAAGGILGQSPEEVNKRMRNALGKVSELSLQFQGGVGAFVSMAGNYRVEIADYWEDIQANVSARLLEETREAWGTFGEKSGTDKKTWFAAEAVKRAWREKHPGIVQSWYDCEGSAISAIRQPGTAYGACDGKLAFMARHMFGKLFLLVRLPSGRCIHYANVRLREKLTPWGATKATIVFDKVEGGRIIPSATYGGDLFQSATQGGARDIMANGWLQTEAAGYIPLFSVHDEMVSEYLEGRANLQEYQSLLCRIPAWAEGCPVTASGYVGKRFRKD